MFGSGVRRFAALVDSDIGDCSDNLADDGSKSRFSGSG